MNRLIALFILFTPALALAVDIDGVQMLPEPSVMGLLVAGAIGAGIIRKMTKKNNNK